MFLNKIQSASIAKRLSLGFVCVLALLILNQS
jgi:hypothetical protein